MDQRTGMADTGSRDLLRAFGPRDVAVLRLLADGRSTGEIAARLSVSSNTARTNIRRVQKKLDVLSNEILLEANEWGGNLAALVSEEMEDPQPIPTHYPRGEYLLLFDPLDGSSNIDVNISVGTIY